MVLRERIHLLFFKEALSKNLTESGEVQPKFLRNLNSEMSLFFSCSILTSPSLRKSKKQANASEFRNSSSGEAWGEAWGQNWDEGLEPTSYSSYTSRLRRLLLSQTWDVLLSCTRRPHHLALVGAPGAMRLLWPYSPFPRYIYPWTGPRGQQCGLLWNQACGIASATTLQEGQCRSGPSRAFVPLWPRHVLSIGLWIPCSNKTHKIKLIKYSSLIKICFVHQVQCILFIYLIIEFPELQYSSQYLFVEMIIVLHPRKE